MKSGNQHKAEGTAKDVKGRTKEAAGSAANDQELKTEGKKDQAKGNVQKAAGDVKKASE